MGSRQGCVGVACDCDCGDCGGNWGTRRSKVHLGEFVIEARVWLNDCDLWGISNMQLTNSNEYTNEWSGERENLQ